MKSGVRKNLTPSPAEGSESVMQQRTIRDIFIHFGHESRAHHFLAGADRLEQAAGNTLIEIFQCPSRNNHIIAQHKIGGQDCKQTDDPPFAAGSEIAEYSYGIRFSAAAERELGKHDRYAQNKHTYNIQQQKRRSAVILCLGGKAPYVPKSDGRPDCRRYKSDFCSEFVI